MGISGIGRDVAPLYRRLPHGPNGMGRDEVARNQRTRLFGAMIESVSRRGYHATTVAHVIALAGVSRRAFYEQFSNKEECFLATYDIVVARARKRVLDAWQRERGMGQSPARWLQGAARRHRRLPQGTQAGAGGLARDRSQGQRADAAGRLDVRAHRGGRLPARARRGRRPLAETSRGIVGGVRHVVFIRMLEQRERELYTLTDELLDWIESYRTPAAARLGTFGLATPPRVPPTPAAFLARDDRRARVLGSVVHLTLDEGYSRLTDPQIAQFAGVSTEAFHKQFANKEECFLAVLDEFVQEALQSVRGRFETAASWPEGVYRAMSAFLEYLVAHEALLRIAFIDLFEVGPAVIGRMTRSVESFTKLLTEPGPPPRRGPEVTLEAVTGAVWAIISGYLANDRLSRLPCLVDHLAFTVLAPYIGPKAAVEAIQAARKPLRSV